jgi:uracil phosphoribosyltransferase
MLCGPSTVIKQTALVKALHTAIRDKDATRHTFVTCSNRLVRLLIEEALSLFPAVPVTVQTPCGPYEGVKLPEEHRICAVSILRAADCMLDEVRSMMPSIAVGKILIQRYEKTAMPCLMYSKLPPDIGTRPVLLLDPMLATGGSAVTAVKVLVDAGCAPETIIFVNVVCVREGLEALQNAYPAVRVVTSAIDPELNAQKYIVPGLGDFGDRYFGTDGVP